MSNYTPATNFLSKDALISGNPLKALKGSELTTEFNGVQVAVNSKFDGSVQFAPDGTAVQPSFGFTNNAGTGMYNAAGVLGLATGGVQRVSVATTGAVTVNAPTSGITFSVVGKGAGATYAAQIAGGATAGDHGLRVTGGNNGTDFTAIFSNSGATLNYLTIYGDGGLVVGVPTGSTQGVGTVNVQNGLYISGSPLYVGSPINAQVTNYTCVLADQNKTMVMSAAAQTFTIPANASVAYPVGTMLSFIGNNNAVSIAITTDTLRLANTASTGTRTLASNGICTALKFSTTSWIISGSGLT